MPIIYKVLYEQAKPKEVIKDLMERSLKSEEQKKRVETPMSLS